MKRTKEDAQLTKESIMESALDVFITKGYSKTTTNNIITKINLTKGAFYFHFNDKEDLFKQVIAKELDFISGLIVDSFIKEGDEKAKVGHLLFNVLDNFYNNKRFRKVILLTWFRVEVEVDCHIMHDKTNFNEFFLEELNKLFVQAHKKGKLRNGIKPLETATHVTALILGIYRMYFVTPKYATNINFSKDILKSYINQIFI
ncbi:TetR/AcrR family transcriptional regulator [Aurantibacillus circumpalustris]|uniref:TetR/AcrR family transcriptional regulator n=1 Tax=Aurantibacillus circumpalustris TaxID=3036359 RepID=UPI00295C38E4|nr:TetR/AcrR family transcriptional regulator [Aurantibacillus circumpalustris]